MRKALESLNGSSEIIEQVVELQPNAHLLVILKSHRVTQAGTNSAGISSFSDIQVLGCRREPPHLTLTHYRSVHLGAHISVFFSDYNVIINPLTC